jgi:mono/diheme cytochrome c family protein
MRFPALFNWLVLLLTGSAVGLSGEPLELPADHAERMTRGIALFQEQVAGLLKQHCIKCHGGDKVQGDLDFATREGLLKGGTNGPAIVPFQPSKSYLLKLIKHEDEPAMPDNAPKLADKDIASIEQWIQLGAPYDAPLIAGKKPPRDASKVTAEDRRWWAFQPLAKPTPPKIQAPSIHNDIDRFIIQAAHTKNLQLAPPADKRQLVRRLYLDLLGIPPTPAEMAKALADSSPKATAKLIDQLLARPEYGERWARHWLDVARFAESAGFEQDYDRPGAWAYRDFVIRALNEDMPYDQFVRWQIAGDELAPDNPWALAATGFLGAGVFPTQITANEVERTRYDALDDMLSTTGSAFLGLTIGCARCHDHKFDPIPTRDYYRMLSIFTTTVRSNIDVELDPEKTRGQRELWFAKLAPLQAAVAERETKLRTKFQEELAAGLSAETALAWSPLEISTVKGKGKTVFKQQTDGSYLASGENEVHDQYRITSKTTLDKITGLRLEALADPSLPHHGPGRAGNGNFGLSGVTLQVRHTGMEQPRTAEFASAEADFEQNTGSLSIAATLDDMAVTGWAVDGQIGRDHTAVFTLREALDVPANATVTVVLNFAVNSQHNIGRFRLAVTDSAKPTLNTPVVPKEVAAILNKSLDTTERAKLKPEQIEKLFAWWSGRDAELQKLKAKLQTEAAKEPKTKTTILICGEGYKPMRHHTQGADFFQETYYLERGSVERKQGVAEPGYLQVLLKEGTDAATWKVEPPKDAKFSGRRSALAAWLTDVERGTGHLTARVIVNRLWQHHFGVGLVATPNDFGKTGSLPSHPELLDWLAGELIRQHWQLKPIQRLILNSAVYQQTSNPGKAHVAADPFNALFTRFAARRLEGETLRDSILAVTGELDRTMYGPGTRDEKSKRRSVYFMIKRSQLIGSMVVFDQPEPLVSQGARPSTTVAPQALLLLNGPQIRGWAAALAKQVEPQLTATEDWKAAIMAVYQRVLARDPHEKEVAAALAVLERTTKQDRSKVLTDFCQVMLGLNEFAYLE